MPSHAESRANRLQRAAAMADLYRAGNTLQQIGDRYGITRERVRQLLALVGLRGKDGGKSIVSAANAARRESAFRARRDARTMARFGCDYDTFVRLNEGVTRRQQKGSLANAFRNQERTAAYRGIGWEITFPEWVKVWQDSGHINERGQGKDRYCMARKGDVGPYKVGNVYITTCADNVRDYQRDLRTRGVRCSDGWVRLPERANDASAQPAPAGKGWYRINSKTNPFAAKYSRRYLGCFPTQEAAEAAVAAARNEHK